MVLRRHQEQWERLFSQKKQEFLETDCRQALDISSFEELQTALQSMAFEYNSVGFPDFINKLNPSLQHVKSFSAAISSAAQADDRSTLIWGAVQAVIQCACQNKYAVDEMLTVVATLNDTLPILDMHNELISKSPKLQFHLQDLYDTYMDYCVASIQYIRRSGTANFLLSFIYSSPQRLLEKTKAEIMKQARFLRKEIAQAEFLEDQHKEISATMSSNPLSQVPTDSVDGGGDQATFPVSTVVYYRNYTFLGRDKILNEIHALFNPIKPGSASTVRAGTGPQGDTKSKHGRNPSCCILRGLGGIGKTQIALEYSYRFRNEYDAIFWVRAESDHALAPAFADISKELHLTEDLDDPKGQQQGRAIDRANKWLTATTERRWLLIFDNAEDMDDLNPYFPFNIKGSGDVIITTQKEDFFPVTNPASTITKEVGNLNRNEGAEIIFKYLRREPLDEGEQEAARSISDLLDGLPLALATIGGYLNQTGSSVLHYYDNLKTSSKAFEASAIGPARQYEKRLETVFDKALEELPSGARSLINMLAFFNPDIVPEKMFLASLGTERLSFIKSEADFVDMIGTLRRRQLVKRDTSGNNPFLSIHRTVQWSVLLNLSKDRDHRWQVFHQCFVLLQACLPETSSIDNPEPENWSQYNEYVPQLLNLRSHCLWPEPPVELPVDFAKVLSDMATYIWQAGLVKQGLEAMHTAENILDDQDIARRNPLRGRLHEHFGIIASFDGVSERDEALKRREKAIEVRKAEFEAIPKNRQTLDDKIRRYNVESDMAFGHLQWEDFDACEQQLEKCLAQYQQWGTEEDIPFEYVKYNHCISYVRMAQGEAAQAIRNAKKGVELAEVCAGLLHPTTYLCRFTLTNLLYLAGELEAAIEEARVVLEARSKICGEYNHWTLETYAFYASLLAENGKYQEAEAMYLKCLDRRKWAHWNQEGVARTQYLYAQTLENLGDTDKARTQFDRARKTRDFFLKSYPRWLKEDPLNELAVFDQMVSMWAGRYTGKLRHEINFQDADSFSDFPPTGNEDIESQTETSQGTMNEVVE